MGIFVVQKAFAENAMINENTRAGVINLNRRRHENQAGNKKKYGLFTDIYLCRKVSIEKKFKCLIWRHNHSTFLLLRNSKKHFYLWYCQDCPSSSIFQRQWQFFASFRHTNWVKWYGWWWWWSNYFQANIWKRPKRV